MKDKLLNQLLLNFDAHDIIMDAPMSKYTSFKVGGNADLLLFIKNTEGLLQAFDICKKHNIKPFVIGKGSNLLVKDGGYNGVIINTSKMNDVKIVDKHRMKAYCGASMSSIANMALKHSLTGFEFASGIPGTFGGGVYMNAGAYDGEMKGVFVSAEVFIDGEIKTFTKEEMQFGYRTSILQKNGGILVSGIIEFSCGVANEISVKMAELNKRRSEKQPLDKPSGGSTFKRPEGFFAAKLITDAGLSGYSIGGAKVSEKHNGFVINDSNATAKDILDLIKYIQETVYAKYGIMLEPEIRVIGEEQKDFL